jgi:hypothetical protein
MLIVISTGLAGCGGGSATPQPSQPTSGIPSAAASSAATGAPSGGPSAAATESNPPGDIPDNQVYVRFTPPGARVSLKVPEGWAQSTAGAATAFSDKLNRIEVVLGSAASAPTAASVSATELPKLQSTVPRFGSGKVTSDHRSAGQVILVTYQGDSAQDPVTGKVVRDAFERYIYYRNGRRLDLTLSGPTNADNVDPWKIVSDSVAWQ